MLSEAELEPLWLVELLALAVAALAAAVCPPLLALSPRVEADNEVESKASLRSWISLLLEVEEDDEIRG